MKTRLRILPAVIAVLGSAMALSCSDDAKSYVKNVGDGETTPTMLTSDVHTFISDSGYTRYYITAPTWAMYEEAAEPHWKFPDGLRLEQYDRELRTNARMRCDSAIYLSQKRVWQLDGHVVMVNVNRDTFVTQQVFWDQNAREVYSDSFVHIVRSDRVIEGYGFKSNETMTAYSVNRPTGIFPTQNLDQGRNEEKNDTTPDTKPNRRRPGQMQMAPASIDAK